MNILSKETVIDYIKRAQANQIDEPILRQLVIALGQAYLELSSNYSSATAQMAEKMMLIEPAGTRTIETLNKEINK